MPLVDNATSHSVTKVVGNVTVKFLPPNLTREVQPLEQRTIRAVKLQYRWQTLWYAVTITETNNIKHDLNKQISVLHAIRWLSTTWEQI